MELHVTHTTNLGGGRFFLYTRIGILAHEGVVRDLVIGLKYHNQRENARLLAEIIVDVCGVEISQCDVITWAPTTDVRVRDRGLDHAEHIARHVSILLKIPVKKLLRRTNTGAQTGASREDRLGRPQFISRPLHKYIAVALIDDVITTGATFQAASEALAEAGVNRVLCVAPSRA